MNKILARRLIAIAKELGHHEAMRGAYTGGLDEWKAYLVRGNDIKRRLKSVFNQIK